MAQWFKDGLESVMWNIVGNLMPLYVMLFISISDNGLNWDSIYIALSSTFHFPYFKWNLFNKFILYH